MLDPPSRPGMPLGNAEPPVKKPRLEGADQSNLAHSRAENSYQEHPGAPMPVSLGGYVTSVDAAGDEDHGIAAVSGSQPSSGCEHESDAESGYDSDSELVDLDVISEAEFRDIVAESPDESSIEETRLYLKTHGPVEFLQRYLPTTATSRNILEVIVRLGFVPRNASVDANGDQISGLVRLLNQAMKVVLTTRTRLHDFYNLEHVKAALASAKKVIVLSGAGISTSLGIPDFRSSEGFYAQLEHLGLSDPQDVFDLGVFHSEPQVFYLIAHMILPPQDSYTPMHAFIKMLDDKGILLRNYTQNIDNLESNVGLPADKVVQCHGSFAAATCVTCHRSVPGQDIFSAIRNKEVPYCTSCTKARLALMDKEETYVPESYGVMKPDITFFGEPLPERFHDVINDDLAQCDLVISVGTSLKVAPVADIVDKVPLSVPQILINRDPITHCNFDVSLLGYCDEVALFLESQLGWIPDKNDAKVEEAAPRIYRVGAAIEANIDPGDSIDDPEPVVSDEALLAAPERVKDSAEAVL